MAISVDWGTQVILVPQADLTLVSAGVYELDVDTFRLALKDLEDDEAGMPFPRTHNHVAPITVGGVTLARVVEVINGYTVTFEDGQYAVNLVGANNNIADVTNVNQVSIRSQNSAGLAQSSLIEELAQMLALTEGYAVEHLGPDSNGAGGYRRVKDATDQTVIDQAITKDVNSGVVTVERR